MEGYSIKDIILSDAIATAIETQKKCEKMKIIIFAMSIMICGLIICLIGG